MPSSLPFVESACKEHYPSPLYLTFTQSNTTIFLNNHTPLEIKHNFCKMSAKIQTNLEIVQNRGELLSPERRCACLKQLLPEGGHRFIKAEDATIFVSHHAGNGLDGKYTFSIMAKQPGGFIQQQVFSLNQAGIVTNATRILISPDRRHEVSAAPVGSNKKLD
jgi:hypothetical protein